MLAIILFTLLTNFIEKYTMKFSIVTSSSIDRFETDSARFYQSLEMFAIGQCQSEDAEKIINFYQGDFDNDKLLNDRSMF